jgi:hypothetical protein
VPRPAPDPEKLRAGAREEEHDRRAAFAQESTAQSAAVEAALGRRVEPQFTKVISPIDGRVGRAIVTEHLVERAWRRRCSRPSSRSIHFRLLRADEQIFLKYLTAAVQGIGPAEHRPARPRLPIRMAPGQ